MKTKIYYPLVGQILRERYQILHLLGTGAFSQTYAVCDLLEPGQPQYALKHYPRRSDRAPLLRASQETWYAEAQILQQVGRHPQIPQFIEAFESEGGWYLVQEAIAGQTLSQYLSLHPYRDRAQRERETIALLDDVLRILEFLHRQGIVHCDLKPNNLIRRAEDNRWVVIDFGNAQPVRPVAIAAKSAIAVRGSGYLAAELLSGRACPESDIYALGAIAIEVLAGQDPARLQLDFKRGELSGWQEQGDELEAMLEQMVRHAPKQRYASARTALQALAAIAPHCSPDTAGFAPLQPNSAGFDHSYDSEADIPTIELESFASPEGAANPTFEFPPSPDDSAISPAEPNLSLRQIPWKRLPFFVSTGLTFAAVNTAAIAFGMHAISNVDNADPGEQLLAQAKEAYLQGNLDRAIALARAIPPESFSYKDSQAAIGRWQNNWQKAATRFQTLKQAAAEERWETVLNEARDFPQIGFWQQKIAPLVAEAEEQAETEAQVLLEKAFALARARNFTRALDYLEQISPQTTAGASIQPKLEEYRRKQQVRATALLQEAYNLAEQREFQEAIAQLEQIAPNTPISAIAREKITEYTQKHQIKAESERSRPAFSLRVAPPN